MRPMHTSGLEHKKKDPASTMQMNTGIQKPKDGVQAASSQRAKLERPLASLLTCLLGKEQQRHRDPSKVWDTEDRLQKLHSSADAGWNHPAQEMLMPYRKGPTPSLCPKRPNLEPPSCHTDFKTPTCLMCASPARSSACLAEGQRVRNPPFTKATYAT